VWAALDVAIASALQAAWYYKWLSPRPRTARRERPIEYAVRTGQAQMLPVLFDGPDELNPSITRCPRTYAGTPRHPAYPSGHSTYAGAASAILRFFFGNDVIPPWLRATPATPWDTQATRIGPELDNLADNIGMGRLWAGIHWRSDHTAGLKLGRTVARLVLEQLFATGKLTLCITQPNPGPQCQPQQPPCNEAPPPSIATLEKMRDAWMQDCDTVTPQQPCGTPVLFASNRTDAEFERQLRQVGEAVTTLAEEDQALLDASRTVQRGADPEGEPEDRRPSEGTEPDTVIRKEGA
jgi:hypothetical protein